MNTSPLAPASIDATLTKDEVKTLGDCETRIQQGFQNFVAVGQALVAIRDGRLYRDKFATFEAYCKTRWEMGKSHAYRLIDAAEVIATVSPIGDAKTPVPCCEAQVRPLVALAKADAKAVWEKVLEQTKDKEITAKIVAAAAAEFKPAKATGTTERSAVTTPATMAPAAPPRVAEAKPAAEVPPVKKTDNEAALEAADRVVTYLRTPTTDLSKSEKRGWARIVSQINTLCEKMGIETSID